MQNRRAILFANGELDQTDWFKTFFQPGDFLIAVDGGLNHLDRLQLIPDLLVGDLDSVTPEQIQMAKSNKVEIKQFPVAKDETDLELALLAAIDLGYQEMIVVAALGKRLDQTLGNLSLLMLPELKGCDIRFEDGAEEVFIIHETAILRGQPGDTISLIPLWGEVIGVTTENLTYPLRREILFREHTRGISNSMTENIAKVSILSGALLCIHTLKSNSENLEQK